MQTAVLRRFGRNIEFSEALQMARNHTISGLLSEIQESLEVQISTLEAGKRFDQAVHEAKLGRQGIEQTIESRKNLIFASESGTAANLDSEKVRRQLLEVKEHVVTWRHDYGLFLRAFGQLYSRRMTELELLKLPEIQFKEARAEIDGLFSEAMDKSVEPTG